MSDSRRLDEKRAESKRIHEERLLNARKEFIKSMYADYETAVAVINKEQNRNFTIQPRRTEFQSMVEEDFVTLRQ